MIGWKVGFTTAALQERHGVTEPVLGFLLGSGVFGSGDAVPVARFAAPGVEVEVAFLLKADLAGPGVTTASARLRVRLHPSEDRAQILGLEGGLGRLDDGARERVAVRARGRRVEEQAEGDHEADDDEAKQGQGHRTHRFSSVRHDGASRGELICQSRLIIEPSGFTIFVMSPESG